MPPAPTIDTALRIHARTLPDAPALIAGTSVRSHAELAAAIDKMCADLRRCGLRRGDRVVLHAPNSIDFVITLHAVLRAGGIAVPISTASAPAEVDHVINHSGAAIEITADGRLRPVIPGAPRATIDDDGPAPRPDDDALILYTSGTTGSPKGALFDHARAAAAAEAAATAARLTPADRVLIAAPLYHAAALGVLLFAGAVAGAAVILEPGFDSTATPAALERHGATVFFGVPTMYQLMLRDSAFAARDLGALRLAMFGGSAMPVDTVRALRAALPATELLQLCGQTEGGPGGIYSTAAQVAARPDSSGHQAMPGSEIRLDLIGSPGDSIDDSIDDGDSAQPTAGVVGELLLRGPSVMKGYWRDPDATAAALVDGWLRTGDLARVHDDGSLTLVDRLKDMIVTGGRNVYSAEVERVIRTHPAVADCAVIGEPSELYGETVVAIVEVRPGSDLTLSELQGHCRQQLSGYKVPRRLLVRTLPRTATAKTDKSSLRRDLAAQRLADGPNDPSGTGDR